jgi:hypothetical protein
VAVVGCLAHDLLNDRFQVRPVKLHFEERQMARPPAVRMRINSGRANFEFLVLANAVP